MPWGRPRKEDPFARIKNWDDGYEYIRQQGPSPSASRDPSGYFTPPMTSRSVRGDPHEQEYTRRPSRRDEANYTSRRAYPSPPSEYDRPARSSRHRRGSSPPPPYRSTHSPSPVRRQNVYEARPAPPSRRESWQSPQEARPGPPLQRSMSTRDAPHPRSFYSRSPSPPPRRRESGRGPIPETMYGARAEYYHPTPSPPRHRERDHYSERRRGYSPPPTPSGDRHRRSAPRYRSPSPVPRSSAPKGASHRPGISRSKSTSAKAAGFAGLSPRWQQAAAAAFKAGSQAALQARSQPGKWNGEKGARIATAALGAAAMKALKKEKDKDDGRKSHRGGGSSGRKNSGVEVIGGAVGNFIADQFVKKKMRG